MKLKGLIASRGRLAGFASTLLVTRCNFLNPAAGMERKATEDVQLSDGTVIPKGALTIVEMGMMYDGSVFPDSHGYNPRRFLEMRQ